jgi:hypothetical protein
MLVFSFLKKKNLFANIENRLIIFLLSLILTKITDKLIKINVDEYFWIDFYKNKFYLNFIFYALHELLMFVLQKDLFIMQFYSSIKFIKKNVFFICLLFLSCWNITVYPMLFSRFSHRNYFIISDNDKKIYKFSNNFLEKLQILKEKEESFISSFCDNVDIIREN